jgi:Mce-associated membrane protein
MAARRLAWWGVVMALVVGTVAALALGFWQIGAKKPEVVVIDGPAQRAAVQQVASTDVERIFTFTPESIDANNAAVQELMTESFGREFKQKAPDATKLAGGSARAKVVGTAVLAVSEPKASVLVFMNRTVSYPDKEPIYDGSRIKVDFERVDGKWLIGAITPV